MMSCGISRNPRPRAPLYISRNAIPIISAVRSVVITSDANLLMGVIISVWRNSCSPPIPYCFSGELPSISSIGLSAR